jgi:ribosomal protein S18 acetylase RimI-like enzyme
MPLQFLNETNIVAVRTLLASTFVEDPLLQWLFEADTDRLVWTQLLFQSYLERYQGTACVSMISEGEATHAAAVWRFPGHPPADPNALSPLSIVRLANGPRTEELIAGMSRIGELRSTNQEGYLHFVAVDGEQRGRGQGALVLADGLAECARRGLPVRLESTNPRNYSFYERLGFIAAGEVRLGSGPVLRRYVRG